MPRISNAKQDRESFEKLMLAAARVVGKKGYKGASIARIAEEAGMSIGHCYKFFDSRDAILENLILWVFAKFERYSEQVLSNTKCYLDFEFTALAQYFAFQKRYPFFMTILRESEVETPDTWSEYVQRRYELYTAALTQAYDAGEIGGFDPGQIPHVSRMLSAIRRAIFFGYPNQSEDCDAAIRAYQVFVRQALSIGDNQTSETKRLNIKPIMG